MKRWICLWLAIAFMLSGAAYAGAPDSGDPSGDGAAGSIKRVGVQTGTNFDSIIMDKLPDAQVEYYNTKADLVAALTGDKIDGFVVDEPVANILIRENPNLTYLPEYLDTFKFAFGFSKTEEGQRLRDEFNAFLKSLPEGALEEMEDKWFSDDESRKTMPDIATLPSERGTLRLATESGYEPFEYVSNGAVVGYDMDLAAQFCEAAGYGLQIIDMNFDAILPSVQAGKCDLAAAGLSITPERSESVYFSDPSFLGGAVLVVLKDGDEGASPSADTAEFTSIDQLDGRRIAVTTGTVFDAIVQKALPEAKILYLDTSGNIIAALEAGKIDAFVVDDPTARAMCAENKRLKMLDDYLDDYEFAFVLSKSQKSEGLLQEINAWLQSTKESGELQKLLDKWIEGSEDEKTLPDYKSFPAEKGVLTLATEGDNPPLNYFRGQEIAGLEIDLAARFCEDNGYGLRVSTMSFDGILPAVQSGKADFAAASISITEERKESVNFSVPYYTGGTALVVLRGNAPKTDTETVHWLDYNGKRLGVLEGPLMEDAAKTYFPDSEYLLFKSYTDCVTALLAGKIDAYLGDEPGLKTLHAAQPEIDYIHERIVEKAQSFAFRKDDPESAALCEELNAFLERCWADGTMDELSDIWFGVDEEKKLVDMSGLTGEKGTLRVVTTSTDMPYSYIKDGKNVGYDIDLVVRFCREAGYALELGDVDFAGRIPAIQSGKYDFSTDMNVTPERQEEVLFSDPTSYGGIVLGVPAKDLQKTADGGEAGAAQAQTGNKGKGFIDSLRESFEKTFLREERWRLFLSGVETTLLITLLTILAGTLLGFGVFMLCRNGNPFANHITRFALWLVQGMPMVVLLMILYYVIFGQVDISGIAVAVLGFTLTFGAAVFGLLKMGVGAVDNGQYEAAYALGYSNRRTFFKIILPQAIPHILPAYRGEIVGLIKATAIVGYIAVQDLTKMGDIVRSRTYEAFFPLIAVTIIYFALEELIGFFIGKLGVNFNPKRRTPEQILKGVKRDDQN